MPLIVTTPYEAMASYFDTVVADGPTAYWRLDEASGQIFDSVGSTDSSSIDQFLDYLEPPAIQVGNSIEFGNDTIFMQQTAAVTDIWGSGGTIEVWLYPFSQGGGGAQGKFAMKGDNGEFRGYAAFVENATVGVDVRFGLFVPWNSGAAPINWKTNSTYAINNWYHVVITYNSSGIAFDPTIYVNGSSVAITETGTPSGSHSPDLITDSYNIGSKLAGNQWYVGRMDEYSVYKTILTPTQVANHYAAGTA